MDHCMMRPPKLRRSSRWSCNNCGYSPPYLISNMKCLVCNSYEWNTYNYNIRVYPIDFHKRIHPNVLLITMDKLRNYDKVIEQFSHLFPWAPYEIVCLIYKFIHY